ncbi:MAG: Ig-like domain-containing protein [Pseudohongiellaceae bacterium]
MTISGGSSTGTRVVTTNNQYGDENGGGLYLEVICPNNHQTNCLNDNTIDTYTFVVLSKGNDPTNTGANNNSNCSAAGGSNGDDPSECFAPIHPVAAPVMSVAPTTVNSVLVDSVEQGTNAVFDITASRAPNHYNVGRTALIPLQIDFAVTTPDDSVGGTAPTMANLPVNGDPIQVSVMTQAGNLGNGSVILTLTDSTGYTISADATETAATVTVTEPDPGDSQTPNVTLADASNSGSNDDLITNDSSPTFNVTNVVNGASVRLFRQSSDGSLNPLSNSVTVSGTSAELTSSVVIDGTYNFVVQHSEPSKTGALSTALVVTIDTAAPTVTVTGPANTDPAMSKTVSAADDDDGTTVMMRLSQGNASCPASVPNGAVAYSEGTDYVLSTEADNGNYHCFYSTDVADNVGVEASGQIDGIDVTAPTVTITAGDNTITTDDTTTLTVTLSEPSSDFVVGDVVHSGNGSLGTLTLTSGSMVEYTGTFTAGSAAGTATFNVSANAFTDAAGNNNTAATELEITVEAETPTGFNPRFSFASGNPTMATEGDTITLTFDITPAPVQNNTIEITVSQSREFIAASDRPDDGLLTINVGAATGTMASRMVDLVDDMAAAGGGTIVLTLEPSAFGNSYLIGSRSALTITVADAGVPPSLPTVTLTTPQAESQTEASGASWTLLVAVDPAPAVGSSVVVTLGSTVSAASCITSTIPATVTVTNTNEGEIDFVVTGKVDNNVDEPDCTITISVTDTADYNVSPSQGSLTLTITDDDDAVTPPAVTYTIANVSEDEGDAMEFVVMRSAAVTGSAETVSYTTNATGIASNAANAADFTGGFPSGTAMIAVNGTMATITVTANDDTDVEENETFNLRATVGGTQVATATGTIENDDAAITYTIANVSADEGDAMEFVIVRSAAVTGSAETVSYTTSATGTNPADAADFTGGFPSGTAMIAVNMTMATITVTASNDTAVEPNETFSLRATVGGTQVATATGTIENDDVPAITYTIANVSADEGDAMAFVVVRSAVVTGSAETVSYTTDATGITSNAANAADFTGGFPSGTAMIAVNATMATITVTANDDTDVEENETFNLRATVGGTQVATATGTIENDDVAITYSVANVSADEGDAMAFVITRSADVVGTAVSLTWAVEADGSTNAANAADFTGGFPTGTAMIAVGARTTTVMITANDDDDVEPAETFDFTVSEGGTEVADATGTITNDDRDTTPPTVTIAGANTAETNATITITLTTSEATTDFAIEDITATGVGSLTGFSGSSGTDYTVTFNAGANPGMATLSVAANAFNDAAGNGNTASTVHVITVDDTMAPTVTITGTTSLETAETATITFTLSEAPGDSTTFALADITATGGTMSDLTTTGLTRTATFTAGDNEVTAMISVAADVFNDAAGNGNEASAVHSIMVTDNDPTVMLSAETSVRTGDATTITFTLSEAPSDPADFTVDDITLSPETAGTLSALAPVSGTNNYTATFTAGTSVATTVTISVVAGAFTDAAGNDNIASDILEIAITIGPDLDIMNQANLDALSSVSIGLAMEVDNIIRHRMAVSANGGGQGSGLSLQGASPMQFLANQARGRGNAYANGQRAAEFVMPRDIGFTVVLNGGSDSSGEASGLASGFADAGSGSSGGGNADNPVVLWGRTFYTDMNGTTDAKVDLDGDLSGVMIGIDVATSNQIWGLGVLGANSELSYKVGDVSGVHETSISGLHPYFGLELDGGARLWGTVGFNKGKVEIVQSDDPNGRYSNDVNMRSYGFGGSRPLSGLGNGTDSPLQLGLIGDAMFTNTEEDGPNGTKADSGRARVGLEVSHDRALDSGNTFRLTGEATWRQDFGDGFSGGGAEIGGGLDIVVPNSRLVVGIDLRTLLFHSSELSEWGVGLNFAWAARPDNRGLSLTFNPQWGPTGSQANQLWQATMGAFNGDGGGGGMAGNYEGSYGLEVKYGLSVLKNKELLELYARGNLVDYRGMSLGANFSLGETFTAGYEAALGYGGYGGGSTGQDGISSITSATPGTLDYIMRNLQPGTVGHQYFNTGSTYTSPLQQATATQSAAPTPAQKLNHRAYIRYHKRF